ncbi:MAG: sporulation protein YqfD [Bacilli bacterium]|jgi:sporulation protein YqfD
MKKYAVSTAKSNLIHLNRFRIKNLRVVEEKLEFITDKRNLEEISKIIPLEYLDLTTSKLKTVVKKHLITIIGTLIIIFALIIQSKSIREVIFTDPDTYNPEVLSYLDKYFDRFGPLGFLKENLTTINTDLRSEFYHYEWIGIRRNGATLYIDIREIKNAPIVEDKTPGSIYAKESGIVKKYHVERGLVLVQEEVYVEKGTLLISGELIHLDSTVENIRAKGYVIAEVLRYHDYTIRKVKVETVRTGRMEIKKNYYFFSKKLNKHKVSFQEYESETGELKTLGLIKIEKEYFYEIKEVKTVYSEEEAIAYAKSQVVKAFRKNKVSPLEKIIYNKLVKIEFDGTYYRVRLIVKTYQNIAEFIPLIN